MDNVCGKSKLGALVSCEAEYPRIIRPRFLAETVWDVEHWRKGKLLSLTSDHNICTDEGLNALLNIMFDGGTQIAAADWFVLIFETDTTPAAGTTYATPVFTESAAYGEATRPAYTAAAAVAKVTTNTASKASFTMNATKIIYGGALVGGGTDADTKSDAAGGGTLYCASKFASSKSVENGDVLKVTIAITAADA